MPAEVAVTACDAVTAFGPGLDACWDALGAGRSAVGAGRRPRRSVAPPPPTAECALVDPAAEASAVWQLCQPLLGGDLRGAAAAGAEFYLATTVGEVEYLERAAERGGTETESRPARLAAKLEAALGLEPGRGSVISAACASGSAAAALAARRIRLGLAGAAAIVACDSVSEFVLAGFGALMALDPSGAHPFDRGRQGLSLGEGAAAMVLMDADAARAAGRPVLATVAGWGLSDDAHHITGPSRDGSGLAAAISDALRSAEIGPGDVAAISAHGTGTVYNDAMEMQAFKRIFAAPVPLYGIKGAIGHTLGAAGLIEAALAARVLAAGTIPATVGLREPDPEAAGWVSARPRPLAGDHVLCVNAGFGGINAALVLRRPR